MTLTLHDHQQAAVEAVEEVHALGISRALVVLPTGAGKTPTAASWVDRALRRHPSPRAKAVFFSHTDELVTQIADEYRRFFPDTIVGVYQGGRRETWARVISASIASCYDDKVCDDTGAVLREGRLSEMPLADIKVIVVDEAHHAVADLYLTVLRAIFDASPDALMLGVTATPRRGDGKGLGELWNARWHVRSGKRMLKVAREGDDDKRPLLVDVPPAPGRVRGVLAYAMTIRDGWERGFLCRLRGDTVERVVIDKLDLSRVSVSKSTGDFVERSLADVMDQAEVRDVIVKTWLEMAGPGAPGAGAEGRLTIAFCAGVKAAQNLAAAFNAAGVKAACVDGKTAKGRRRDIIARFAAKGIRVLTNCMALTEGFNVKAISCGLFARPTKSTGVFAQQLGRILRVAPGKVDALAIDFAGAVDAGLVALPDLSVVTVDGIDDEEDEAVAAELDKPADVLEAETIASVPPTIERRLALGSHRYQVDVFGGGLVHFAVIGAARVCVLGKSEPVVVAWPHGLGITRAIAFDPQSSRYMVLATGDDRDVLQRASACAVTWGDQGCYRPGPWLTNAPATEAQQAFLTRLVAANAKASSKPLGFEVPTKPSIALASAVIELLKLRLAFATRRAVEVDDIFDQEERVRKVRKKVAPAARGTTRRGQGVGGRRDEPPRGVSSPVS